MDHHRVFPKEAREIMWDHELIRIWMALPDDMILLVYHIVKYLNLIDKLRDGQ